MVRGLSAYLGRFSLSGLCSIRYFFFGLDPTIYFLMDGERIVNQAWNYSVSRARDDFIDFRGTRGGDSPGMITHEYNIYSRMEDENHSLSVSSRTAPYTYVHVGRVIAVWLVEFCLGILLMLFWGEKLCTLHSMHGKKGML